MAFQLSWKTIARPTGPYLAACRAAGLAAADTLLDAALGEAADAVIQEIDHTAWDNARALTLLAALASESLGQRELAESVARRLGNIPDAQMTLLAGAIADLDAARAAYAPQLEQELKLRLGPLREQWEARGPGLLIDLRRKTEDLFVPDAAEATLVAPYAGGHGLAFAPANRFLIEAVLANPLPEIPETLRIAWLVCQLNSELPRYAEALSSPGAAERVVALAAISAVLSAGEYVELCRCDEATIAAALSGWHVASASPAAAATLLQWWTSYVDSPFSWPAALAALEQMLAPGDDPAA